MKSLASSNLVVFLVSALLASGCGDAGSAVSRRDTASGPDAGPMPGLDAGGNDVAMSACPTPPTPVPSAGFTTPNAAVPFGPAEVFDAEGNVAADGHGHVAVSFIAVMNSGASGVPQSSMGVAAYTEGKGFAPSPQEFASSYGMNGITSDPVVAYDRTATSPRLYLVWVDVQTTSPGAPGSDVVKVSHSDGYGAPGTWSAPVTVSPSTDASGFIDKPWIVARNRTVAVTYSLSTTDASGATVGDIHVVRSSDGGTTWGPALNANTTSGGFSNLAMPALDTAGDLWVTWFEQTSFDQKIMVGAQPAGSSSFTKNTVVPGSTPPAFDDPSIAVDDSASDLWVTFTSADLASGTNSNVWALHSTDAGSTFGAPILVNDDDAPGAMPCAVHFHSEVALDASNHPMVLWYDNRYGSGNVMFAHSSDGAHFGANQAISDMEFPFTTDRMTTQWLGDYGGLAADATKVYAAWADPRSGVSRMYYAERSLP